MRGKIAAGLAFATAAVGGRAHAATIKTVALQTQTSPRASLPYKRFREVAESDAVGQRVAVIATLRGTRCLFSVPVATFRGLGQPSMSPGGKVAFLGRIRRAAPPMLHGVFAFE